MKRSLKSNSYNGNATSTATRKTTAQHYQMELKSQDYPTRPKEHCNNISNCELARSRTISRSEQSSWTTTRRFQLSQDRLQQSAQTTMEELHQWMLTTAGGKEETTKAKEKAKATTKEAKAKASTGAKDTTRDSTKATKEATTKEDTTRAREKATQDPKDMDQARAWPLGPGLQSAGMAHRRRRRTTSARTRTSRSGQQ